MNRLRAEPGAKPTSSLPAPLRMDPSQNHFVAGWQ
jgi:hypothetical protein